MISAGLRLPGVRLAVVSQQPLEALDNELATHLVGHWRVDDVSNAAQLKTAVLALSKQHGNAFRCFAAYEQAQEPLAQVREELGIEGIPHRAAMQFRNKSIMKDVLRMQGVPVARHRLISSRAAALAFVEEVGFPIVIKPPAGAGAQATERIKDVAQLDSFLSRNPPKEQAPLLAEEFLKGIEHSLETVSIDGEAVWHSVTRYAPSPLTVLENPWIQWTVLLPREVDSPEYDDIRAVGRRALETLGMTTGVSHCEWFRREDGSVAISEIGARPPGANMTTMISRANDIDFVEAWMRLMVFGTFEKPERKYAVGTAYLRGQGQGRVVAVEGLDVIQRDLGSLVCDYRLPHAGQWPTGSYEGEGFVMVRHSSTAQVSQALEHIVSTVRVRLA